MKCDSGDGREQKMNHDEFPSICMLRDGSGLNLRDRLAAFHECPCVWHVLHGSELPSASQMRYSLTMISAESVTTFIRQMFPDAQVTVIDKTGTQDHLIVRITSDGFVDKNLLDRHRMVYQALAVPMKDGRIHALEISATTKAEAEQ